MPPAPGPPRSPTAAGHPDPDTRSPFGRGAGRDPGASGGTGPLDDRVQEPRDRGGYLRHGAARGHGVAGLPRAEHRRGRVGEGGEASPASPPPPRTGNLS